MPVLFADCVNSVIIYLIHKWNRRWYFVCYLFLFPTSTISSLLSFMDLSVRRDWNSRQYPFYQESYVTVHLDVTGLPRVLGQWQLLLFLKWHVTLVLTGITVLFRAHIPLLSVSHQIVSLLLSLLLFTYEEFGHADCCSRIGDNSYNNNMRSVAQVTFVDYFAVLCSCALRSGWTRCSCDSNLSCSIQSASPLCFSTFCTLIHQSVVRGPLETG